MIQTGSAKPGYNAIAAGPGRVISVWAGEGKAELRSLSPLNLSFG
jgi:hypothetical protein